MSSPTWVSSFRMRNVASQCVHVSPWGRLGPDPPVAWALAPSACVYCRVACCDRASCRMRDGAWRILRGAHRTRSARAAPPRVAGGRQGSGAHAARGSQGRGRGRGAPAAARCALRAARAQRFLKVRTAAPCPGAEKQNEKPKGLTLYIIYRIQSHAYQLNSKPLVCSLLPQT